MIDRNTPGLKRRLAAVIAAGALAASAMGTPISAFAQAVEPSAGAQTGSGATDVTVQLPAGAVEVGGNTDENNPDGDDADDYGDNIAFTVPSSINFVARPDGTLIAPKAEATFIENHSVFDIRVSSVKVDVAESWKIAEEAPKAKADEKNVFDLTFGPASDQLNAVGYADGKAAVAKPAAWNMTYAIDSADGHPSDRVELETSGHIAHVEDDIKGKAKLATIRTYVTQGKASA